MGVETALAIGIPLAIGAIGTMMQSGNRSDITQAGQQKLQNMQQSGAAYGAYRPQQMDARMKAMQQQLSAFQGAGNIMKAMYGGTGGGPPGGTYTPGGGGYKVPDGPGYYDPTTGTRTPVDPRTGGPIPSGDFPPGWTQDMYDAWKKYMQTTPKSERPSSTNTPPIYVPREVPNGTGAGSSGTSLAGPLPPSLMSQGLVPQGPPPNMNPMLMALANKKA